MPELGMPTFLSLLRVVKRQGLKRKYRHWAKEYLPSLRFANPTLNISVEPPPSPPTASTSAATPEVTPTAGEIPGLLKSAGKKGKAVAAGVNEEGPWNQEPGVWIVFRSFLLPSERGYLY